MKQTKDGHSHPHSQEVVKQLGSLSEHIQLVQKMISEERPCVDVLNQLAGVSIRLNECRATIVNDHMKSCLSPALKEGKQNTLYEVEQILRQILKGPSAGSFH